MIIIILKKHLKDIKIINLYIAITKGKQVHRYENIEELNKVLTRATIKKIFITKQDKNTTETKKIKKKIVKNIITKIIKEIYQEIGLLKIINKIAVKISNFNLNHFLINIKINTIDINIKGANPSHL